MKNKNSEIENKNNSKNTDATNTNEINLAIDSTRQKQEKAKLEQAALDYGVTQTEVIQNFRLIHQEWKTGET